MRITKIAPGAMAHIDDEWTLTEYSLLAAVGRTFIEGTRAQIEDVRERMHDRLTSSDFEKQIEGGSMRDLSDTQVAFGVRAAEQSLRKLIAKLDTALVQG